MVIAVDSGGERTSSSSTEARWFLPEPEESTVRSEVCKEEDASGVDSVLESDAEGV